MRIRSRRLTTTALALLAASVALTGCDADDARDDVDDRDDVPVPAPSSSSAPAAPAPSAGAADPSTWEIEDGEIGPIEIGEDFDRTLAQLPAEAWTNDENCASVAYWNDPGGAYTMWFARDDQSGSGPIQAIAIEWGPDRPEGVGPRTDDERVGLGSTWEQVRAEFDEAQEVAGVVEGSTLLRIDDDDDREDGTLFFEFVDGQDGAQSVAITTADQPSYEVCG